MQATVVFFMLIKHGIAGQRAVDKERQKKPNGADRTEGGRRGDEQTESGPAGEKKKKKQRRKL